jgi:alanine racemase
MGRDFILLWEKCLCEQDGHLPNIGDWVTLWGGQFSVEAVAEASKRSPYELLVNVPDRVYREYIGG